MASLPAFWPFFGPRDSVSIWDHCGPTSYPASFDVSPQGRRRSEEPRKTCFRPSLYFSSRGVLLWDGRFSFVTARISLVARTKFSHFPILLWGSSRLGLAIRMGLFSAASNSLLPLMDKVFFPAVPARPTRWFKILEIFCFQTGVRRVVPFVFLKLSQMPADFRPSSLSHTFPLESLICICERRGEVSECGA